MNWYLVILIPLAIIGLILLVMTIHDISIITAKTNKIFQDIRANETCAELKSDLAFTDKENEGMWFKIGYDPDVLKYYKEKHCT